MARKIIMLLLTIMLAFAGIASAGNVSSDRARNVARNWLTHVVHAYGAWGGDMSPAISGEESFVHNGVLVGYNYTVDPKGHILVSARDDIPAVKLYSDTSTLSLQKDALQEQIEWIAEEIFQVGEAIDSLGYDMAAADPSQNPDRKVWAILDKGPQEFASAAGEAVTEAVSYGPLLTTAWDQPYPYNKECPLWSTGCRTIVGCVATAASQIMKYWNYPKIGQGSTAYTWNNGAANITLSRDFSKSTYDWANMPKSISSSSPDVQQSAVAKLCADVGVAFHMHYGCSEGGGSGAFTADAPSVFINYFKYQNTAKWVYRSDYASQSDWMKIFKAEVQAGRPSQISIESSAGGHSVVVDGYQADTLTEAVHINMGWSGNYNGWYTPDSFVAGSYTWSDVGRGAAIGIQPPVNTQVTNLWPVSNARPGASSTLWAYVKNTGGFALPSDAKVWYWVSGPNWTNYWVGSAPAGGLGVDATKWYSYNWAIPASATPGTYTYWSRVYQGSTPLSEWSVSQTFTVSGAQITSLWPVNNAKTGLSSPLWAYVKNISSSALLSDAKVWYWVSGPNWTNYWVGSAPVGGLRAGSTLWYSYNWAIPASATPGTYSYWARVYKGSTPLSEWSSAKSFSIAGP